MTFVTLVPRLHPAIDGVGDYAFNLAIQLQHDYQLPTQFIVGDPTWSQPPASAKFQAMAVAQRSAASLTALLEPHSTVFLHYVPHGYAHKACPWWLIHALERWRTSAPQAQLITMFHELYALDWHRPWSSDFYLSPVQQHLAARMAQLSDQCFTSTDRYTQVVHRLSRGKHSNIPVLGVFSNFGEPSEVLPLSHRQRRLILLGQRHSKSLIYQHSQPVVAQVCRQLGIQQIWDIGPTTGIAPSQIDTVPVTEFGKLPAEHISQILSESLAGFLNYDPQRLGKSGIFAAYCAHGLLPINHRALDVRIDGLEVGKQYGCPHYSEIDLSRGQAIARQAWQWYSSHTLSKQAHTVFNALPSIGAHV